MTPSITSEQLLKWLAYGALGFAGLLFIGDRLAQDGQAVSGAELARDVNAAMARDEPKPNFRFCLDQWSRSGELPFDCDRQVHAGLATFAKEWRGGDHERRAQLIGCWQISTQGGETDWPLAADCD